MLKQLMRILLMIPYTLIVLLVATYGFHTYVILYLYFKNKKRIPKCKSSFSELPLVTIQIPLYNEELVVKRVIDAVCEMDYPRDKLQIQVLDDSTNDTTQIVTQLVDAYKKAGYDIELRHRDNRKGFKAGALQEGLTYAKGDFVAIFDADFVPRKDFLQRTIHYFTDAQIGLVQSRWGHINKNYSLLTKGQAIFIDGHFAIEHTARNRSGRFSTFNGTGGVWRKKCIEDAGGWSCDTLTEDLDLSYRAQLKGWKFAYFPDLVSPAELPAEMLAFKSQQHRWTKGTIQTAKKLLPAILKSKLPWKVKIEAIFHLTQCSISLFVVLMALMLLPILLEKFGMDYVPTSFLSQIPKVIFIDIPLFLLATASAVTFYLTGQKELYHSWIDKLKFVPYLMSLGIGISLINAKGIIEAVFNKKSAFIRTPKYGENNAKDKEINGPGMIDNIGEKKTSLKELLPYFEIGLGGYLFITILVAIIQGSWFSVPFLAIFFFGYTYVGIASLKQTYKMRNLVKKNN